MSPRKSSPSKPFDPVLKPREAEAAVDASLQAMTRLIGEACRTATKSCTAVERGDRDEAMSLALDVEPLLHEATILLNAACLLARQAKELREGEG